MTASNTKQDIDLGTGRPITRIVVPVTLDHRFDRGVAVASRLAERWDLPVHLVSVGAGVKGEALDQRQHSLLAARPWLDVDDEAIESGDDPAVVIRGILSEADLVVMATEAVGTGDRTVSFAQALAQEWGGPILMVGPNAHIETTAGDVVVGLDGAALSERAVPVAVGLSQALDSHPWVVQVIPSSVTDHVATLKARGERVTESGYIRDAVDRLGAGRATWEVIHSDEPAQALVTFAERHDASFHVMTTRGESTLARPVFGSVCMETVRLATRPVLVIRPTVRAPEALV